MLYLALCTYSYFEDEVKFTSTIRKEFDCFSDALEFVERFSTTVFDNGNGKMDSVKIVFLHEF